jgi:hypothetical protein
MGIHNFIIASFNSNILKTNNRKILLRISYISNWQLVNIILKLISHCTVLTRMQRVSYSIPYMWRLNLKMRSVFNYCNLSHTVTKPQLILSGPLLSSCVLLFIMFCVPAWVIDFFWRSCTCVPIVCLEVVVWGKEINIMETDCMPNNGKLYPLHISYSASTVVNGRVCSVLAVV